MIERFQDPETCHCQPILDQYRHYLNRHAVSRPVLVVDHEGVLLPFNFHTQETPSDFFIESIKRKINNLQPNVFLLNLLKEMADCDPPAPVMSGSIMDTHDPSLERFTGSYRYGLHRGWELLDRITATRMVPANSLPERSTLFFINDDYSSIHYLTRYLKDTQPAYDTLNGVAIVIPRYTGESMADPAAGWMQSFITGFTREPQALDRFPPSQRQ